MPARRGVAALRPDSGRVICYAQSMTKRPVSFIATDHPDSARTFYVNVLGLTLREASPFALVFADGDHELRVQIVAEFEPAPYTAYGWFVADISKEMRDLSSKGVEFQRFAPLTQDELGVWTAPGGHKIAWFKDPAGNILSLTEDPHA